MMYNQERKRDDVVRKRPTYMTLTYRISSLVGTARHFVLMFCHTTVVPLDTHKGRYCVALPTLRRGFVALQLWLYLRFEVTYRR